MHVIPIEKLHASDLALAGGKAARLGDVARSGLPVPSGFVITTDAWRARSGGRLYDADARDVSEAVERSSAVLFAVRSSAIVEDSAASAWAGQFRTHLDVDKAHIREMVEDCMESGHAPRVEAYARAKGIRMTDVAIAVLVQEMVHPEVAGVAFTVDPVSGDRDRMIIEAVRGSAASVVDGTGLPDTYALDKRSGSVIEARSGSGPAHGVLSEEHLTAIHAHLQVLESQFGEPQDVEWAYADGVCWILQSRPITAL